MKIIIRPNGDVVIKRGKGREPAVPYLTADELRTKIDLLKSQRLRQVMAALADALDPMPGARRPSIVALDDAWYAEENK